MVSSLVNGLKNRVGFATKMFFILSLQDMEGDNKVVNIIEDWDVLGEHYESSDA